MMTQPLTGSAGVVCLSHGAVVCSLCGLGVSAVVSRLCVNYTEYNSVLSSSSLLGDITQKGFEKKRAKLLSAYIPHLPSKTTSRVECPSLFHFPLSFLHTSKQLHQVLLPFSMTQVLFFVCVENYSDKC